MSCALENVCPPNEINERSVLAATILRAYGYYQGFQFRKEKEWDIKVRTKKGHRSR